ncbi:MAG: hypothetical protein ABIQ12_04320 [Opitutaceae bacterium]
MDAAEAEPLFDWSDWDEVRGGVVHPNGAFAVAGVRGGRVAWMFRK